MHGSIESSTPNVHQAFTSALNDTLSMQDRIYKQMEQKGWYTAQQAPQQQVDQVKQKFASPMQ
jgi:spore coat protein CotF